MARNRAFREMEKHWRAGWCCDYILVWSGRETQDFASLLGGRYDGGRGKHL